MLPGHSGICGNNIADELAKEGSIHQSVKPELALWGSQSQIYRTRQSVGLLTIARHCDRVLPALRINLVL